MFQILRYFYLTEPLPPLPNKKTKLLLKNILIILFSYSTPPATLHHKYCHPLPHHPVKFFKIIILVNISNINYFYFLLHPHASHSRHFFNKNLFLKNIQFYFFKKNIFMPPLHQPLYLPPLLSPPLPHT